MRAIMIFIDGVGLGKNDPQTNPFVYTPTPNITQMLGGLPLCEEAAGFHDERLSLLALDATLGVPGLPQSATGQASLFTGENAPLRVGKHVNRYPHQPLKELLREKGILGRLVESGYHPVFYNAYRPEFFQDLEQGLTRPYSCSTFITYYAGLSFRTLEELNQGKAVYMDITNDFLARMGYPVDIVEPEEAGNRVIEGSKEHDFVLFEYFLTDLIGHQMDYKQAGKIVSLLDRFLGTVGRNLDSSTLLIVTSDHGNLEDISHQEHTLNPVPALIVAPLSWRQRQMPGLRDITGVAPFIYNYLGNSLAGDKGKI